MNEVRKSNWHTFVPMALLALILLFFLLLKSYALKFDVGDEWIYHYQALLLGQGFAPYRDFFMAHPPFATIIAAVLLKIFGFSLFVGKALPILASCVTALSVYFITKKLSSGFAGVIAVILFLFSYEVLRASSHFTGVNLTTMFLALALAMRVYKRPALSGLSIACAVLTRVYALPIAFVFLVEQFLKSKRAGIRMLISFLALVLIVGVWLLIVSGFCDPFEQLVRYHFLKPGTGGGAHTDMINQFSFYNFWLLYLGVAGAVFYFLKMVISKFNRREGEESLYLLGFLIAPAALLHLIVTMNLGRLFYYYFVPTLPLFAILAGVFLMSLITFAIGTVRSHRKKLQIKAVTFVGLAAFVCFGFLLRTTVHQDIDYVKSQAGTEKSYTWINPVLPNAVDSLVKKVAWRNPRQIGKQHSVLNYYFWHESRYFESAVPISELVSSLTGEGDTIFGNSGVAPLIALLSDRRIAMNQVDTNIMRFKSGLTDIEELLKLLETDPPKVLVVQPDDGINSLSAFKQYRITHYKKVRSFSDRTMGRVFEVWRRG